MKAPVSGPLADYREVWNTKPALRLIYDDVYDRVAGACRAGPTIEIGGGIGSLKQKLKDAITTDIQYADWLDCVLDAQRLPFAAGAFGNIVMIDVLHHLEFPIMFFREAARILRPGGVAVMVEPAITWGSTAFYRLFHHEPVQSAADVLVDGVPHSGRDPYQSNQAIPSMLVTRERDRFHQLLPELCIARVEWFSLAAYPLSGGFKRWSLVSAGMARRMLRIERAIEPALGRFMAFRMMIIVEKRADRQP